LGFSLNLVFIIRFSFHASNNKILKNRALGFMSREKYLCLPPVAKKPASQKAEELNSTEVARVEIDTRIYTDPTDLHGFSI